MSALTAIEAEFSGELAAPGAGLAGTAEEPAVAGPPRPGLHLVEGPGTAGGTQPLAGRPQPTAGRAQTAAAPLRLTRRGRIVVAVLAVLVAAAVITLIGMAWPSGAQATNHGRAGAGYQGMREIVVQPGQTLFSIASRAEPSADPRLVISEIMTANSLTSTVIQSGQLLWVPK